MNWHRIRTLVLAFVAAFLLILVTGVAVAENKGEIQIFKMGNNVTVTEKQVMTDAVAVGGNVTILSEGQVTQDAVANCSVALTEANRKAIATANQEMTTDALRILGTAYAEIDAKEDINLNYLIWLGLVGITNPIRQGVKDLIADFHRAGIDTVMLTGDQENTAQEIA